MGYKVLELKEDSLRRKLEHLTKQYKSVDDKSIFEQNPATQVSLEAQKENLLEQIKSVEEKIEQIEQFVSENQIFTSAQLKIEEPQVKLQDADSTGLILDIRPTQASSGNLQEYILSAWIYSQSSTNNLRTVKQLAVVHEVSETKLRNLEKRHKVEQMDPKFELPHLLSEWMEKCFQRNVSSIKIEIFISSELAHIGYENWNFFMQDGRCKRLRDFCLVYICNRERYRRAIPETIFYNSWLTKWNQLHQNNLSLVAQDTDSDFEKTLRTNCYWFNGCRLALQKYKQELIDHGVPLALWSRCASAQDTHWQEINALVHGNTLNTVLKAVFKRRTGAPTDIAEDSTELGHHLVLMLENPHHPPPWEGAEPLRS